MLTAEERARGLVTASAGNHAQAVAYHAGRIGVKTEIWMPLTTPLAKVSATRKHGAEVVLHGTSFDEAYTAARERRADLRTQHGHGHQVNRRQQLIRLGRYGSHGTQHVAAELRQHLHIARQPRSATGVGRGDDEDRGHSPSAISAML